MNRPCAFSLCKKYRYTLWRHWNEAELRFVQFIGLNPSTADDTVDDPTIRRCIQFAKDWGYGGICMTNLFAFRSTLPEVMKKESDPEGCDNIEQLSRVACQASCIICAWGKDGRHRFRGTSVKLFLSEVVGVKLHCLGLNSDQTPKHPLYLKKNLRPIPFK